MAKQNAWAKESEKHGGSSLPEVREMRFEDDATQTIRILPGKDDEPPFYGYIIHWIPIQNSKKGRPIVHAFDKRCVVCEYISELWGEVNRLKEEEDMTDKSPEVKKVLDKISRISGKKKYDFNILDRNDLKHDIDGKKVVAPKRMTAGATVWKPIFEYAKNPKWGDPANQEEGYDFDITVEGSGQRRTYSVSPDREATALAKDELASIKHAYDLASLRKHSTLANISDILKNAQAPYNELYDRIADSSTEESSSKPRKESKKPAKQEVEEPDEEETTATETQEEAVEEKPEAKEKADEVEEPTEDADEEEDAKEDEKSDEVEEPAEDGEDEGEDSDDPNDYSCKGEFDKEDKGCIVCTAKDGCSEFTPIYDKAKELGIDVSEERSIDEITADVKKREAESSKEEKEEEKSTKGQKRKKRDLPF